MHTNTKSWYHLTIPIHYPFPGHIETHMVCTQTSEDMTLGRKSTSGHHFGVVIWSGHGGADRKTFEQRPGVYALGHIHENATLHPDVVAALEGYGVVPADGLRDALKKIIAKSGIHQLAAGEL